MKVTYKSKNGRFLIEASGDTVKDVFAQIGGAAAVFEAESTCGKCNSADIRPNFKIVKDGKFKYYELICMACRAQFSFGQATSGDILFPKRKDDDGPLPNRGWHIFAGTNGGSESGDDPNDYGPNAPPADDGSQGLFDQVAARLKRSPPPISFEGALNMMRDALTRAVGDRAGLDTYNKIHKAHESKNAGKWDYEAMRLCLLDMWGAIPKRP